MIPTTLHFIWVQDERPWGYGEWIALMSALRNTTYRVLLHTNLTPDTPMAAPSPFNIKHDRFLLYQRPFDLTVEGVRARPANISDLERVRLMFTDGGIYSDLDIWWQRDLDLLGAESPVAAYENPAYKTVANAFLASEPGWPGWKELEEQMLAVFRGLAAKGITDLRGDPGGRLNVKHHALLWKLTGNYLKSHGATLLGKNHFYKNGWRRIGRAIVRTGLEKSLRVDPRALGTTKDAVDISGITGFHYYAGLYDYNQVMIVDPIWRLTEPLLTYGMEFMGLGYKVDTALEL